MRESSIVPTNLLDWPRCGSLLPDQRLILLWLWSSPWLTCAGCGAVPMRPAAATLGLSPDALAGGISDLVKLKLVMMDYETGELFINDWFRFHKFKNPVALKCLAAAIKKIQSDTLKNEISIKTVGCFPTLTSTSTSTSIKDKHTLRIDARPVSKSEGVSPSAGIPTEKIGCARMAPVDVDLSHTHCTPLPQEGKAKEKPKLSQSEIARLAVDNPELKLNELMLLKNRLESESEAIL